MRPLRDYAQYFNDSLRQELLFEDAARVMIADTATMVAANAKALEQETYRSEESAKLKADREGFQREAAAIGEVLKQTEARFASVRSALSALYNANLKRAAEIKTLQLQWAAAAQSGEPAPAEPSGDAVSTP
jgi:hypothetical protein